MKKPKQIKKFKIPKGQFIHPAMKIQPIKNKNRIWSKKVDSDHDGVPNFKDCQPFNPWRQDRDPGDWMDTDMKKPKVYSGEYIQGFTVFRTKVSFMRQDPLYVHSNNIKDVRQQIKQNNYGSKDEVLLIIPGGKREAGKKFLSLLNFTDDNDEFMAHAKELGMYGYIKETDEII